MQTVIDAILKEKLIVILQGLPKDRLIPFAEAVYRGGVRLLEVLQTLRTLMPIFITV